MRHIRFGTAVLGTMVLILGSGGDAQAQKLTIDAMVVPLPPMNQDIDKWHMAPLLFSVPSAPFGTEFSTGDRIQFYDVAGLDLTSALTISGGPYAFSSMNSGPLPPSSSFTDNPSIPNLVLTYEGPTLTVMPGDSPISIGDFTFNTIGFPLPSGFYFAAETQDRLATGGTSMTEVSYGFVSATSVPEPPAWVAVLLTALPATFWYRRRRSALRVSAPGNTA